MTVTEYLNTFGLTGGIKTGAFYDKQGNVRCYDFTWKGGDFVAIGKVLWDCANSAQVKMDGNLIRFGPFRLAVVDQTHEDYIIARRIRSWRNTLRYAGHRFVVILYQIFWRPFDR